MFNEVLLCNFVLHGSHHSYPSMYVVGTNLSWRKEGELVPACKSVCGNMHAQTKPVSMLLPVSVAIGKCETIFNHIQAYR